jgi:hypothetical protein
VQVSRIVLTTDIQRCRTHVRFTPERGHRWDPWSKHPACDERNQEKRQQSEHIAAHKCLAIIVLSRSHCATSARLLRSNINSAATFITGLNR